VIHTISLTQMDTEQETEDFTIVPNQFSD